MANACELAWLYPEFSAPVQEAARRAQELEMEMLSSTSPPERTRYSPIPPSHHQLTHPDPSHHGLHSTADSPAKPEKNGHAKDHPKIAKIFEIQSMPNGKTRTSLKTMSRRKLSQQKEKKATQMLAIVLGESGWLTAAARLCPAITEERTHHHHHGSAHQDGSCYLPSPS